jgi:uncharacterized protein YdhG (YjbR/CyaY superfamily)
MENTHKKSLTCKKQPDKLDSVDKMCRHLRDLAYETGCGEVKFDGKAIIHDGQVVKIIGFRIEEITKTFK